MTVLFQVGPAFYFRLIPLAILSAGSQKIHFLVPPLPALALFVLNVDLGLGEDFPLTSLGHHAGCYEVAGWGVLLTGRR